MRLWRRIGILIIAAAIAIGIYLVTRKGQGLYLGLILVWAGPFVLLLWYDHHPLSNEQVLTFSRTLAYQLILGLPLSNTVLPIGLPTVYLWIVDTLALKRGTWVIESGTKLGWHLWDGLETEEAVFFLVTNTLIVFGLIAFDNGFAILQAFPDLFPEMPPLPSPILLIGALLISSDSFDAYRIKGLKEALTRLSAKSRSFCLASVFFEGRLREDLILLYSYCRVADDLVDEASSSEDARHSILNLQDYLNLRYNKDFRPEKLSRFIESNFPPFAYSALELLPARHLSSDPFRKMLSGFGTDLKFTSSDNPFPIKDEDDLKVYASQVAGTVAVLCLKLVFHHCKPTVPEPVRSDILLSGESMGIALQFVNIARDISKDAAHGRVYLPTSWLAEEGLTPGDVTKESSNPRIDKVRERLLDLAFEIYGGCKSSIEELPYDVRGPIRVAVESYFEIGRVLREPGHKTKAGRATVPKLRRLKVAWKAC